MSQTTIVKLYAVCPSLRQIFYLFEPEFLVTKRGMIIILMNTCSGVADTVKAITKISDSRPNCIHIEMTTANAIYLLRIAYDKQTRHSQ